MESIEKDMMDLDGGEIKYVPNQWKFPKRAGEYEGIIKSYDIIPTQYGTAVRFVYELYNGDEMYTIPEYIAVRKQMSDRSKLYQRYKNIFGHELQPNEYIKLKDFVGKRVRVLVQQMLSNGRTTNKIISVVGDSNEH